LQQVQKIKKKVRKEHRIKEHIESNSEKYRSYRRFLRGITSNATKECYAKFMKNFMEFSKLKNYDDTAKLTVKKNR